MAFIVSLLATPITAILYPEPPPVYEVRFYTLRSRSEIGETVRFVLENRHTLSFCYGGLSPWTVAREVMGEWRRVELHWDAATLSILPPGESLRGSWRAETEREPWPDEFGLVDVLPGLYHVRIGGALCDRIGDESIEVLELRAYFSLIL